MKTKATTLETRPRIRCAWPQVGFFSELTDRKIVAYAHAGRYGTDLKALFTPKTKPPTKRHHTRMRLAIYK
jgi:hypothetical protein